MSGLEARDLALARGGRTLYCGLSLALAPGEVRVILGPNGVGKSSLLLALAGLLAPQAGEVLLDGVPLARLPAAARARAIGFLPQNGEVAWNLEVETLVGLGRLPHLGPRAAPGPADRAAIARALEATDTARFARRPVASLSGGERARVLLARVLAGCPQILLVDEPLQSLDPGQQLRMVALLRTAAAQGAAVAVVVHDLPMARRLADSALLLAPGGAITAGPAAALLVPGCLSRLFGVAFTDALVPGQPCPAGDAPRARAG